MLLTNHLRRLSMPCVAWLDGSFLTQKIEPDDIDAVFVFDIDLLDSFSGERLDLVEKLRKQEYGCEPRKLHTFVSFSAPLGHPSRIDSVAHEKQWEYDFGHALISRQPKGIALLEIRP